MLQLCLILLLNSSTELFKKNIMLTPYKFSGSFSNPLFPPHILKLHFYFFYYIKYCNFYPAWNLYLTTHQFCFSHLIYSALFSRVNMCVFACLFYFILFWISVTDFLEHVIYGNSLKMRLKLSSSREEIVFPNVTANDRALQLSSPLKFCSICSHVWLAHFSFP